MIRPIENFVNKVIHGDSLEVLKELPEDSIDMVFVDPPYNLQLPNRELVRWSGTTINGVNDGWDKFESFEDYDKFTREWLEKAKKIMKTKATIWVIGTYHNIFRVGKIMQNLGFRLLNDVIWLKTNPMPNFRHVRFTNATETLIWAVKDKSVKGHTFNFEYAQKFGVGNVGANVWKFQFVMV